MSTLKHQHAANPEISEDSIADYLQANPEFFERHSGLLNNLRLPHDAGGPTVSLVERQILVLRQKNLKLENKLKELVDIARGNDALAGRIHSLAMLMLAAPDQAGVIKVLEEQLRVSFNADRAILVVFDEPTDAAAAGRFLRVVDRDDPQIASFRTFMQSNAPRCGQIRDAQRDFLFGPDNIEIGSAALVPLGAHAEMGFLAIGSRDSGHFHPGMSIDFLTRLGELVSCALRIR
ncbi:MAG: DUF484 family protein [Chromatiales bacterium]|jgi:uncharacterized protein YigA (DUF484 family)|nr:DUF484 family protein [Chromatiales bacterium]